MRFFHFRFATLFVLFKKYMKKLIKRLFLPTMKICSRKLIFFILYVGIMILEHCRTIFKLNSFCSQHTVSQVQHFANSNGCSTFRLKYFPRAILQVSFILWAINHQENPFHKELLQFQLKTTLKWQTLHTKKPHVLNINERN